MPKPNTKDAAALAAAAGTPEASTAPAPAEPKKPYVRTCVWSDDSQFNLESWIAGKLRATIVAYDIPGIGKCELTFREMSGQDNREIDAMMAQAANKRTIFSELDVARFRNVAITAASITAINKRPWPEIKKTADDPEAKRRMPVEERDELLRGQIGQTMLDLYVKATSDFQEALLDLVRAVDPKLFASPSGGSEAPSPSAA